MIQLTKIFSVQVAHPDGEGLDSLVNSTAICAGSGGSVLSGADADVYWTGEMSHVRIFYLVLLLYQRHIISARGSCCCGGRKTCHSV